MWYTPLGKTTWFWGEIKSQFIDNLSFLFKKIVLLSLFILVCQYWNVVISKKTLLVRVPIWAVTVEFIGGVFSIQ